MSNNVVTGVLAASVLYAIWKLNNKRSAEVFVEPGSGSPLPELVAEFKRGGIPTDWMLQQSTLISSKDLANRFRMQGSGVPVEDYAFWAADLANKKHTIETHEILNKNRSPFYVPNPTKRPTFVSTIGDPDDLPTILPGLADNYMYRYSVYPAPKIGGPETVY